MDSLRIVHYPHPALRHAAKPVVSIDKQLRLHAGRMFELMYEAEGLGLAATQVAVPCQFVVMNLTGDASQTDAEQVYLNPVIVSQTGWVDDREGCLSFPGLFATVKRARQVVVEAYDLAGAKVRIKAEGLAARAWQHEIEHLQGRLFIERFGPLARMAHQHEIRSFETQFRKAQESGEIPPDAEIERALHLLATDLGDG